MPPQVIRRSSASGTGPVHRGGRELVLGELLDPGHGEDRHRPVGAPHVDAVAAVQGPQPEEDPRPGAGVDVPGDDGGADRARPRAAGVPARHRGARRHLERAVGVDAEVDQLGPDPDRRDAQPGRPGRLLARASARPAARSARSGPGSAPAARAAAPRARGTGWTWPARRPRRPPRPARPPSAAAATSRRACPSDRREPGQVPRRPQAEGGPGDLAPRRRGLGRMRLGPGGPARRRPDAPLGHGDARGLHRLPGRIPPVLGQAGEHGHGTCRPAVPHRAPHPHRLFLGQQATPVMPVYKGMKYYVPSTTIRPHRSRPSWSRTAWNPPTSPSGCHPRN